MAWTTAVVQGLAAVDPGLLDQLLPAGGEGLLPLDEAAVVQATRLGLLSL